jgi:uncharacterized protein (TIGR02145 family)
MRYLLTSLLCVFTLSLTAQEACPNVFDFDNDGNVAVNDFLAMLGYFGDTDTDSDGVWDSEDDCIDETACNYQANPTEPCLYSDALGVCGGYCIADDDGDGICDPAVFNLCGDLVTNYGYDYTTVQIGEQCWFSENCRFLPEVSPSSEISQTEPYYYVYNYNGTDVESAMSTDYYETYGALYNYSAVMADGICPSGWHIPSDEEFTELTDFLGGASVAGYKMKSTSGWNNNGNGSNSSGFTALSGGYHYTGGFANIGGYGVWWSSSEYDSNSWRRTLYDDDTVHRDSSNRKYGNSARCLQD